MGFRLSEIECRNFDLATRREWLLTNGIGGYAMGTVAGVNTRRYHGHLVAAITPPTGRRLLLAGIEAEVKVGSSTYPLSTNQYPGAVFPDGYMGLIEFESGEIVRWRWRVGGTVIRKEIQLGRATNATTIRYINDGPHAVQLSLKPLICDRDHHGEFSSLSGYPGKLEFGIDETMARGAAGDLFLSHPGAERLPIQGWYYRFEHERERERGLPDRDDLFCPCDLRYTLLPGQSATVVAAMESKIPAATSIDDLAPAAFGDALRACAKPFFVETAGRASIVAGYPWFTDWGRDTMISIPGLCNRTGRTAIAKRILSDYGKYERDGLIPNRFPDGDGEPDYNTVDATLWFGNAVYDTLRIDWDDDFAREMFAVMHRVYRAHIKGTHYGIAVDPEDGLLTQGEDGVQLTWMDAKIGDWVVTPRHGKPIEVNALWINFLRILEWIATRFDNRDQGAYRKAAEKATMHFDAKYWHEGRGHYLDTVDPNDASLRPNQVIGMALPFAPYDPDHARSALVIVARELLTPIGLRTLGPSEPGYRGRFEGAMQERDAAYHQGTVWPWLLGSYTTAVCRYFGDRREARRVLRGAREMLNEYGLGGIAEVYDGDAPHRPGGCPWQAWSLAEILRSWTDDIDGDDPSGSLAS